MTEGNEILHMEALPEGWSHCADAHHHSWGQTQTQASRISLQNYRKFRVMLELLAESSFETLTVPTSSSCSCLLMIKLL